MEVLFHLIFQIIKIAILASIYSILLYKLLEQINKRNPREWISNLTSNFKSFIKRSGSIISVILFTWMFSYWGNHGLGDSARIPIGNGYEVKNINWTEYGYIDNVRTSDGRKLETSAFYLEKKYLIGNLNSWFRSFTNKYFCLNTKTRELKEFKNKEEMTAYLATIHLNLNEEMGDFKSNYSAYWHGWRFWLLP